MQTAPRTGTRRAVTSSARERLLEAGTRLIAERGIEAVNTNVIARAAGVGVGTFYAQFEDKHALHRSAVVRALDGLQAALSAAPGGQIAVSPCVPRFNEPFSSAQYTYCKRFPGPTAVALTRRRRSRSNADRRARGLARLVRCRASDAQGVVQHRPMH